MVTPVQQPIAYSPPPSPGRGFDDLEDVLTQVFSSSVRSVGPVVERSAELLQAAEILPVSDYNQALFKNDKERLRAQLGHNGAILAKTLAQRAVDAISVPIPMPSSKLRSQLEMQFLSLGRNLRWAFEDAELRNPELLTRLAHRGIRTLGLHLSLYLSNRDSVTEEDAIEAWGDAIGDHLHIAVLGDEKERKQYFSDYTSKLLRVGEAGWLVSKLGGGSLRKAWPALAEWVMKPHTLNQLMRIIANQIHSSLKKPSRGRPASTSISYSQHRQLALHCTTVVVAALDLLDPRIRPLLRRFHGGCEEFIGGLFAKAVANTLGKWEVCKVIDALLGAGCGVLVKGSALWEREHKRYTFFPQYQEKRQLEIKEPVRSTPMQKQHVRDKAVEAISALLEDIPLLCMQPAFRALTRKPRHYLQESAWGRTTLLVMGHVGRAFGESCRFIASVFGIRWMYRSVVRRWTVPAAERLLNSLYSTVHKSLAYEGLDIAIDPLRKPVKRI